MARIRRHGDEFNLAIHEQEMDELYRLIEELQARIRELEARVKELEG